MFGLGWLRNGEVGAERPGRVLRLRHVALLGEESSQGIVIVLYNPK